MAYAARSSYLFVGASKSCSDRFVEMYAVICTIKPVSSYVVMLQ
jgi:hypothetical protein